MQKLIYYFWKIWGKDCIFLNIFFVFHKLFWSIFQSKPFALILLLITTLLSSVDSNTNLEEMSLFPKDKCHIGYSIGRVSGRTRGGITNVPFNIHKFVNHNRSSVSRFCGLQTATKYFTILTHLIVFLKMYRSYFWTKKSFLLVLESFRKLL